MRVAHFHDADLNAQGLVFLEEVSGSSLEIQRTIEPDEDDDRHCVVVDGCAVAYGAIEHWELNDGALVLHFTAAAAVELAQWAAISLTLDAQAVELVARSLPGLVDDRSAGWR